MGLNVWGVAHGQGTPVALGLSEGPVPTVLELAAVGIPDAAAFFAKWQQDGPEGLADLMRQHPARRQLGAEDLCFPFPVSDIWAAGVTYERSREAREEESEGFQALYTKVYDAERPELFYKHAGSRMAQPGEMMGIRPDAEWHVPEPELTVVLGPDGSILGFTVGNDLSSRDIEAANPLYLPQAKIFYKSASLGPSVALAGTLDPKALEIRCEITRGDRVVFDGNTSTARMRRSVEELVGYAGVAMPLPPWTCLMTGTGIVPPDAFALAEGDVVSISISGIGTLRNPVRTITPDWIRQG